MPAFQATRMKVQLKLCINRLKMLQKKKSNLAAVSRKEIAALLEKKKDESARIKVEHIIREDYMIEALELVELYCDILLARFGLIESLKYPEESIKEPITTLIWVTPRLSSEVTELLKVREHLVAKYGKEFAMQALENSENGVNDRIIHKLNMAAPDPILVTQYLVEIAKSRNIEWEPPAEVQFDEGLLGGNLVNAAAKFDTQGQPETMLTPHQPYPTQHQPPYPAQQQPPYPSAPGHNTSMPEPQHARPMKPLFGSNSPSSIPTGSEMSYANNNPAGGLDTPDLPPIPNDVPEKPPRKNSGRDNGGAMDAFDDLEARFRNITPGGASAPPPSSGSSLGPPPAAVDFDDLTARFNMLKKQ